MRALAHIPSVIPESAQRISGTAAGAGARYGLQPSALPAVDDDGTGVVGIELVVDDVDAVLERAQAIGVRTADDTVKIGGVAFTPVSGE